MSASVDQILYGQTPARNDKYTLHVLENGVVQYFDEHGKIVKADVPEGAQCGDAIGPVIFYLDENGEEHRDGGPAIEWGNGCRHWICHGKLHRADGPAKEWDTGHKEWWVHGKHHREDGPATIEPDGSEEYWLNNQRHRGDGPAVVGADGHKAWWVHGKRHREDGPAMIKADGSHSYHLNGVWYPSQLDWEEEVRHYLKEARRTKN